MENQYCFECNEANQLTHVDLNGDTYLSSNFVKMLKMVIGTYIMSFNFHHDILGLDTLPTSILQVRNGDWEVV